MARPHSVMMIHHPLVLLLTRFIHTVLRSSLRMWAWQSVVLFKGSYKFARISWQFSLCVSRLTKSLTSSATHLVMGFIARDQSTNNKQTNKLSLLWGWGGVSKGLNCMMQVTVADLSTMTKQWHPFGAADLPQLQRLQKGSLCCKCVPGHWRWPQHSYHTYPTQRALSSGGILNILCEQCNNVTHNENWEFYFTFVTSEWV
jgi:hypothetical protein